MLKLLLKEKLTREMNYLPFKHGSQAGLSEGEYSCRTARLTFFSVIFNLLTYYCYVMGFQVAQW